MQLKINQQTYKLNKQKVFMINCYNLDNYLLKQTTNFACASTNIFVSQPFDRVNADPGYWRPAAAYLANLPAVMLSTTGVIVCATKVTFQIIAKTALECTALCGSHQAKKWSHDIDISLTMRKLGLFAIGLSLQTVGIVIFPLGFLTQAIYFHLVLSLAEIEIKIQLTEMIQQKRIASETNEIKLTVDDISEVADKMGCQTVNLCASGLVGYTIKQLSTQLNYSVQEEHLQGDGSYALFNCSNQWKNIPIDQLPKRMKNDLQEIQQGLFNSKMNDQSKYQWTLEFSED